MGDLSAELTDKSDAAMPLGLRFKRVKTSAESIWELQRLPWFTDHRAQSHSAQLTKLLGEALDHLQSTPQRLNRSELFILLSACYLHDIGMQDLTVGGRGMEELTVDDFEIIRRDHPRRGKELIIARSLRLERDQIRVDLDDDAEFLLPIALVSQGHGSAFFEDTLEELATKEWSPDSSPVRTRLLTALLLIADELDIRSQRSNFPKEANLSPVSELHHYLNHFVTGTTVRDGETSKLRQVRIHFEFAEGSDDYRPDVRQFITDKLVAQIRRVNRVFTPETDGEISFATTVAISEQTDCNQVRRSLPADALHELRRQLRRFELVGRARVADELKELLERDGSSLASIVCREDSDIIAVLRWLQAEAEARKFRIVDIPFKPTIGRDAEGILEDLAEISGVEGLRCRDPRSPVATAGDGDFDAIVAALAAKPTLLLFRDLHVASHRASRLALSISQALRSSSSNAVTVATQDGSVCFHADTNLTLGPITSQVLSEYLQDNMGYGQPEAAREAERVVNLSEGSPEKISVALAVERQAAQIND